MGRRSALLTLVSTWAKGQDDADEARKCHRMPTSALGCGRTRRHLRGRRYAYFMGESLFAYGHRCRNRGPHRLGRIADSSPAHYEPSRESHEYERQAPAPVSYTHL